MNRNIEAQNPRVNILILLMLTFSLVVMSGRGFISPPAIFGASDPGITILSPKNTTYTTTSVQLTFTIDKETSWIGYSLDFLMNITIVGNTTLAELSEGEHTVIVFANGTSGLVGASERVYFTISPLHDIAIINVSLPFDKIYSGETIGLNVTVRNKGTARESFNVTVHYNSTIIDTKPADKLTQGSDATLTYAWNTTTVPAGVYIIKAQTSAIVGETHTDDNTLAYGTVRLYPKPLVQIKPSAIQAKVERDFEIGIWIANVTNLCHFEFNLSYNSSLIYIEEVFVCDEYGMFLTSPYSKGTINNDATTGNLYVSLAQANEAKPVNGSGQLAKIKATVIKTISYSWSPNSTNFLQCTFNLSYLKIGVRFADTRFLERYNGEISVYDAEYWFTPVPGDLNLDGMTDIIDLCGCAKMFGTSGQSPFDLNGDRIIDHQDLILIAKNIGRTKP